MIEINLGANALWNCIRIYLYRFCTDVIKIGVSIDWTMRETRACAILEK